MDIGGRKATLSELSEAVAKPGSGEGQTLWPAGCVIPEAGKTSDPGLATAPPPGVASLV
jgi:hypothetical protein